MLCRSININKTSRSRTVSNTLRAQTRLKSRDHKLKFSDIPFTQINYQTVEYDKMSTKYASKDRPGTKLTSNSKSATVADVFERKHNLKKKSPLK